MAIKKLQNNYTTPEQSNRLLELGVPIDSADMHISYSSRDSYSAPKFNEMRVSAYQSYFPTLDILPCWSVGRLIEIWLHCNKFSIDGASEPITIGLVDFSDNFIDDFIHLIKKLLVQNVLTFQNWRNKHDLYLWKHYY